MFTVSEELSSVETLSHKDMQILYRIVSEELSSVETRWRRCELSYILLVSEELSSVETLSHKDMQILYRIVSEELSSVETKISEIRLFKGVAFQKNLVVWKPGRTFSQSGLTRRMFQKNLVVWKPTMVSIVPSIPFMFQKNLVVWKRDL